MKALSVHHLAVVVSDLGQAERFYVGVLGLKVIRRWEDDYGEPRSFWLDVGDDMFLAVERAELLEPQRADQAPGWHCLALAISPAEREAWRARLFAAGFPVERESDYTIYARDPDGNWIAFSHYPQRCAPAGTS